MSDLARVGADAFCRDAVVRGEDVDGFADGLGRAVAPDRDPLRGEVFETAEAAEGFSEIVEARACGIAGCFARSRDVAAEVGDELVKGVVHRASMSRGW